MDGALRKVRVDWGWLCWKITWNTCLRKLYSIEVISPDAFGSEHTSYVHVLVHSCTAQVGSCTELFMYRYVHVQVSSCTGNIIKCPPLIFKCNYITCVCKGIRVYMYTPSFDDIWNCSTPRLEFSIDFSGEDCGKNRSQSFPFSVLEKIPFPRWKCFPVWRM